MLAAEGCGQHQQHRASLTPQPTTSLSEKTENLTRMAAIDFITSALPDRLNWGTAWGLGTLCMLILRITQVKRPGTTAHIYKTNLAKHYAEHPVMQDAPLAWQTLSWFVIVLRDMILWPIFFPIEWHRALFMWRDRIRKRRAGICWMNPALRSLSRRLLRHPERYQQLCLRAGVPRLATAITLTAAHPELIPDLITCVPEKDSPLATLPDLSDKLRPESFEWPYLTAGFMRVREEEELWPGREDRFADMVGMMRQRSLNRGPWGCAIFLAHYACGLAMGWLPSDNHQEVVEFLSARVDGEDRDSREVAVLALMDGLKVVPSTVVEAELKRAQTLPERFRIYHKLGELAETASLTIPAKSDTAQAGQSA